jgi:hypothetical protein
VDDCYLVPTEGIARLERFGIASDLFKRRSALITPWHIDWSERKHHVAGKLGAALANRLLELHWIERHPDSRAIHLTDQGRAGLEKEFELCF